MWIGAATLFALALGLHSAAYAAASETAKADAARKKPLQRCDQLNDKAELECLHKAREGIVEARKKRENTAEKTGESSGRSPGAAETSQKK